MGKPKITHVVNTSLDTSNASSTGTNNTQVILNAIENSLAVLVEKLDRQEETIKQLTGENKILKKEIVELKQHQKICHEEVDFLKGQLNIMHQEKFNCDVVLSNTPVDPQISTTEIVDRTLQHLSFQKEMIIASYDVTKKKIDGSGFTRNVYVKFRSHQAQIDFLAAKKARGPIFHQQIFGNNSHNQSTDPTKEMFVNERLTTYNLQLLREARKIQRAGLVKYAWHQLGNILIRKQEGAAIKRVRHLKDIQVFEDGQTTQPTA